jgi:hypothetical protein
MEGSCADIFRILFSSGAHDQIFITLRQLRSCFCGALSLTRGRVCILYMLLVVASTVFHGSESLGSRDYILLSQFWDFPFRRLLRLAGSRWRYSNQPPHGCWHFQSQCQSHIATDGQSISKSCCRAPVLFDSYGLVFLGRPLWREDGAVFCTCCWSSPA